MGARQKEREIVKENMVYINIVCLSQSFAKYSEMIKYINIERALFHDISFCGYILCFL